ncbi:MAG: tRNA uridine-5-carboxymethylaminomethyl(34) synthesis GTPase MnmE [Proteobacteria bacterium]|nr:tRNA uridine-5-carboxymethylaminomethyl(34) synthesis GTPase MnmE [Pseudomonadota bacterium]MBU1687629.1 tRNA uridine-5-carboxymethylaminomethyl(34) synthesis GTPase MnmE [Pseudomonadota bacterium]
MQLRPSDHNAATIAAISTPPGVGGIGIVRISGTLARPILTKLFAPSHHAGIIPHRLSHGWINSPDGRPLDEVMSVYLPAPHTYTREDVVEIQCHGSTMVLQAILAEVLAAGAIVADPGEFTKRAFLNGRIDLTQAEAVIDLLSARTGQGMELALSQLQGGLNEHLTIIREGLMAMKAVIEVAIDFPDEEVEIINPETMLTKLRAAVITPLDRLVTTADRGKIIREGIGVVILGRPNVGKSSLLNSLLREDRAIVTDLPGTTRDIIEEYLDIRGIPVRIVDTAGIREDPEAVEEIGIKKARQQQEKADLVLLVVDGSIPPTREDQAILNGFERQPVILVINKIDLVDTQTYPEIINAFPDLPKVKLSAKTGTGLSDLEEAIRTAVIGTDRPRETDHNCLPNIRHRAALIKALEAARRIEGAITKNLPADLLAIDLQSVLDHLGDIIGETTTEDILDLIFEKFCLGK